MYTGYECDVIVWIDDICQTLIVSRRVLEIKSNLQNKVIDPVDAKGTVTPTLFN
jgi:hypothetical protein